jgi:two-component system, chemotaxis family, CheB/CheR fusion protein
MLDLEQLGRLARERPDVPAHFLASIVESSEDAIISKDLNGVITSWNRGAEHLFGYTSDEAIGQSILMLIPPDRHHEEPTIIERIKRGERIQHYDTLRRRKDGTLVDISLTVSPVRSLEGDIIGASKIARDITERRQAHERQQFLMRELRHRSANLFAVIQAIVSRSLVEPCSLAQAKEVVIGRLQALAGAHAMLAQAAWEGAPLTEILKRELEGFSDQLSIRGCDLVVNTPAAQQFSLMAHELATNAIKHGALSLPDGRISVGCEIKRTNGDGTLLFEWKETDGPKVLQPRRKGFGSVILLDAAKSLADQVALEYEPDGLRYAARFPLSAIEAVAPRRPLRPELEFGSWTLSGGNAR